MYAEDLTTLDNGDQELEINFGKNGRGLSDELIGIGEKINELSKKHKAIYLVDTFVDLADDVYMFKFKLSNKGQDSEPTDEQTAKNKYDVHIITWDKTEYDRECTAEEIARNRELGYVIEKGEELVFDFSR